MLLNGTGGDAQRVPIGFYRPVGRVLQLYHMTSWGPLPNDTIEIKRMRTFFIQKLKADGFILL